MNIRNKLNTFLQTQSYSPLLKREFQDIILSITNDKTTITSFKDRLDYYYKEIIKKLKSNFVHREVLADIAYEFLSDLGLKKEASKKYRFTSKELYSTEELYCKIIQLSQKEELTQQQLAEKLGDSRGAITRQAISKYTASLRDGYAIMGTNISLNIDSRDRDKVYSSSIHPAFMALNLSEVYALTIGLKGLCNLNPSSPMSDVYDKLSERIYSQLTDYGRRIIDSRARELNLSFSQENHNYYHDERSLPLMGRILYYLKSGEAIHLIYNLQGEAIEYKGKLTLSKDTFDPMFIYKGKSIVIEAENILDIKE